MWQTGTPSSGVHVSQYHHRQAAELRQPPPKCFTCGVVGHKSPDCLTRIMVKREPEDKSKKDKKKTLHTNRVSLSEENLVDNEIQVTMAYMEIPLLLDTGTHITILLEVIVPTTAKTGEVCVKGYLGCAKLREMARVKIKVEDMTWFETVALAPSSELNGKGLLAVNLCKKESWEILDLVRQREFAVCAVETRGGRKDREKSKKEQEELTVRRENASTTAMHGDEVDEKEVQEDVEAELESLADEDKSLVDGE